MCSSVNFRYVIAIWRLQILQKKGENKYNIGRRRDLKNGIQVWLVIQLSINCDIDFFFHFHSSFHRCRFRVSKANIALYDVPLRFFFWMAFISVSRITQSHRIIRFQFIVFSRSLFISLDICDGYLTRTSLEQVSKRKTHVDGILVMVVVLGEVCS